MLPPGANTSVDVRRGLQSEEACKTDLQYNDLYTELRMIVIPDFVCSLIFELVARLLLFEKPHLAAAVRMDLEVRTKSYRLNDGILQATRTIPTHFPNMSRIIHPCCWFGNLARSETSLSRFIYF